LRLHHSNHTRLRSGGLNILRVAGQIAASAYGGPGGGAAYAAWLAYSETKDFGLSLKVGLITGAAAYATGGTTKMIPGTDPGAIAQKTLLAGAIGGAAVAAAGGDKQAIQEGFLRSGGAVLVQSLYEAETHNQLDARASKGPAYCMAATDPTAPCAPPKEAYELDRDGKPILDRDGQPRVDVRKTDHRAPHVGQHLHDRSLEGSRHERDGVPPRRSVVPDGLRSGHECLDDRACFRGDVLRHGRAGRKSDPRDRREQQDHEGELSAIAG
jgi:hypothetical protein